MSHVQEHHCKIETTFCSYTTNTPTPGNEECIALAIQLSKTHPCYKHLFHIHLLHTYTHTHTITTAAKPKTNRQSMGKDLKHSHTVTQTPIHRHRHMHTKTYNVGLGHGMRCGFQVATDMECSSAA